MSCSISSEPSLKSKTLLKLIKPRLLSLLRGGDLIQTVLVIGPVLIVTCCNFSWCSIVTDPHKLGERFIATSEIMDEKVSDPDPVFTCISLYAMEDSSSNELGPIFHLQTGVIFVVAASFALLSVVYVASFFSILRIIDRAFGPAPGNDTHRNYHRSLLEAPNAPLS